MGRTWSRLAAGSLIGVVVGLSVGVALFAGQARSSTLATSPSFLLSPTLQHIKSSGTRHDELLYDEETLKQIWKLHRVMAALDTVKATEMLIDRLRHTKMNKEFLNVVDKTFKDNELD